MLGRIGVSRSERLKEKALADCRIDSSPSKCKPFRAQIKKEEEAEEERRRAAMPAKALVEIVKFSWHKGGFDSIMIATFTVKNSSVHDVKDLEITCTHSANSGTEIDRNTRTLYERVRAGQTRTFRNVNMGFIHSQASRSGCEIADLVELN